MEIDLEHNELPVRVCSTRNELAKECGVSPSTISTAVYRAEKSNYRSRYVAVEYEEDL